MRITILIGGIIAIGALVYGAWWFVESRPLPPVPPSTFAPGSGALSPESDQGMPDTGVQTDTASSSAVQ